MHLPSIDKKQIAQHGGYDKAFKALLNIVGELSTVEAVCSTFNSIPNISAFPAKDFIILSREGRLPKYEEFKADARKLAIDTDTEKGAKETLNLLLAAILGNALQRNVGENPCHILRVSHRPSKQSPDAVRFELWIDFPSDAEKLKAYLEDLCGTKIEDTPLTA